MRHRFFFILFGALVLYFGITVFLLSADAAVVQTSLTSESSPSGSHTPSPSSSSKPSASPTASDPPLPFPSKSPLPIPTVGPSPKPSKRPLPSPSHSYLPIFMDPPDPLQEIGSRRS